MKNTAIIVVDMQNDFVEGGALAVAGGLALVPVINDLFKWLGPNVVAVFSQDFHPLKTAHFDKWPVHCVAESKGAELVAGLPIREGDLIIRKGMGKLDDGYSAFDGTNLAEMLKTAGVDHLYVCGIATEYCVKATVLDGLKNGFNVSLVENATVAVDPSKNFDNIYEMTHAGASITCVR